MALSVIAFLYHTVTDCPLPHVTPLYPCKSPEQLEQDLLYLKNNFTLVGHDELAAACDNGTRLPERAANISFDDGFAGCFSLVRPLLLKHGIPCTFFLIRDMVSNRSLMYRNKVALCLSALESAGVDDAALRAIGARVGRRFTSLKELRAWLRRLSFQENHLIDLACDALGVDVGAYLRESRPYLTADEVLRLNADGFTIGAHSVSHPQLAQLPWGVAREQILESCEYVRELTGRARVPFAFPFNGIGLSRRRLADMRRESGSIDLMYDTNYLMEDADFIVNRIPSDAPSGSTIGSDLPAVLRRARTLEPIRAMKRWLTGLPH